MVDPGCIAGGSDYCSTEGGCRGFADADVCYGLIVIGVTSNLAMFQE